MKAKRVMAAALLGAALVGAAVAAGTYALLDRAGTTAGSTPVNSTASRPTAERSATALTVNEIYRRTATGVVEITAMSRGTQTIPFGGGAQQAQGSGFVYDEDGHIVTNEHVVDGAESITVTFSNDSTYDATVVGTDASSDLAVLRVKAPTSLPRPLVLADSSKVKVGDGVVAIGSPFGLENSVTAGIVSALHRQMTAPNDFSIADVIQTDAAINHGNSGGVLLDLLGRVIGVTSQIKSESGGNEGVGFAIPSNTVRSVVSQLISSGKARHAYLGVAVQTIPGNAASALGVPRGVEVTEVRAGTPAVRAGLRASTAQRTVNGISYPTGGDVIIRFDGTRITSSDQLSGLVGRKSPGDRVSLTFVRNGVERTIHVTLASRPS